MPGSGEVPPGNLQRKHCRLQEVQPVQSLVVVRVVRHLRGDRQFLKVWALHQGAEYIPPGIVRE